MPDHQHKALDRLLLPQKLPLRPRPKPRKRGSRLPTRCVSVIFVCPAHDQRTDVISFPSAEKLRSNREEPLREIRVIVSADLADASSPFSKALPALTEKLNSCASFITVSTSEATAVDACQGVLQIERFVSATYEPVAKVFQPLPPGDEYWRREDTVVLFKTAVEVVGCMVDSGAAAASGSSSPSAETLSSRIASVKRRLDKQTNGRQLQVVLVIHGLKKYISRKKLDKEMIDREILRVGLMERCFVLHGEIDWLWDTSGGKLILDAGSRYAGKHFRAGLESVG
jgi:hypothetical protein